MLTNNYTKEHTMHELKCPNCGKIFTIDESGYSEILKQVHNNEFQHEIEQYTNQLALQKDNELKLLLAKSEQEKMLAISELQQQLDSVKNQIAIAEQNKKLAIIETENKNRNILAEKEQEITALGHKIIMQLNEAQNKEQALKQEYEILLKHKDEQIAEYKDFKSKLSTKMIGESLEQHCLNLFNALRATAFRDSYFEKDNDAKDGSKGDFIFRDYVDGVETISIMFEMKNEADTTASKHKNEDFFKELDKDRNTKKCEYAVLVSTLESDSELYNAGIVDVSHRYQKMYVVRPQCFIPIITLLRNAALNTVDYKKQIAEYNKSNIDVSLFEQEMADFKEKFGRNYSLASAKFQKAISEIDTTIKHLQNTKDALLASENNLRLANEKAENLTVKRLTKNSPSVAKMFEDAHK